MTKHEARCPNRDTPDIIAPRQFTQAEDEEPYMRPQRPEEIADWLQVRGQFLAPATSEARGWRPTAKWMVWNAAVPYRTTEPCCFILFDELIEVEERLLHWVVPELVRHTFLTDLKDELGHVDSEGLDAARAWVTDPLQASRIAVPHALLREEIPTLCNVSRFPGSRIRHLSPAQWRLGVGLAQVSFAIGAVNETRLLKLALDLIAAEERARLGRLLMGIDAAARPRL